MFRTDFDWGDRYNQDMEKKLEQEKLLRLREQERAQREQSFLKNEVDSLYSYIREMRREPDKTPKEIMKEFFKSNKYH